MSDTLRRRSGQDDKNGSDDDYKDAGTWNSYAWHDGAVLSQMVYRPNASDSSVIYTSTYTNSASGVVSSVGIADGRPRTVTYANDMAGQVVRRSEADSKSPGDPHAVYYRFAGRDPSAKLRTGPPPRPTSSTRPR